jgi:hypothetical protein
VQAGEHAGERTHQLGSGGQFRAAFENGSQPVGVTLNKMITVVADPAGHLADRRRFSDSTQVRAGAVLSDEGTDDAVFAGEALRSEDALEARSWSPRPRSEHPSARESIAHARGSTPCRRTSKSPSGLARWPTGTAHRPTAQILEMLSGMRPLPWRSVSAQVILLPLILTYWRR